MGIVTAEEQHIDECRGGSLEALGVVVREHERMVWALACRLVGPDDARDAAQEIFLSVFRSLPRFRGECALKTWIYRIALRECFCRIGRRRRERTWLVAAVDDGQNEREYPSPDPSPLDELESADLRGRLDAAIGELPDRYRTVIVLRYSEELEYHEIASALGIPLNTVKTWLYRAKELLAHRLNRMEDDEPCTVARSGSS